MAEPRVIRLATRGSALALLQCDIVRRAISAKFPDAEVSLKLIKTSADKQPTRPIHEFGDKGLYVKELEEAILAGEADAAVHSLKDVPGDLPDGLSIVSIPQREDTRDALLLREGNVLADLPPGAVVGTSSPRRAGQLLRLRPDLKTRGIRGNLETRIKKLHVEKEYDGIILAVAGLRRSLFFEQDYAPFPHEECLPAAGQGAIAIEAPNDSRFADVWQAIDDLQAHAAVHAERTFVRAIGADCHTPAACLCELQNDVARLRAMVCSPDGKEYLSVDMSGAAAEAVQLATQAAHELMARGAAGIIERARASDHA